jgi:hypothetical protein
VVADDVEGPDAIGRRNRLRPQSTGKRVTPQPRDLLWFSKLAEHGPLPSSFLLAYAADTHRSEKRARERLTDLFNEADTPHGGPYLLRPPQQFRTLDSRYNQLVYDLSPAGWAALRGAGTAALPPAASPGPWLHRFMVACITASIEIATLERSDLRYIPQSAILARAQTDLRWPISIRDPVTGEQLRKELVPDAIFGLEYLSSSNSRFRFFAVEADRATEPATSTNFNRKSFLRSLLQYGEYVECGIYREHLRLTAPLLVLHVSSDPIRTARMVAMIAQKYPDGNAFSLFQTWEDFGPAFRPPDPRGLLLTDGWVRGALLAFNIDAL